MIGLFAASPQAQAVLAFAYGGGLRKGEIAGLDWSHYERTETGAVIHVRQSVWRGTITTPKNVTSATDAHLHSVFCDYIEAYREICGSPEAGLMFCYSAARPINLESFARWTIRPVLKAAGISWKGYHAFRRGNATLLAKLKDSASAALMLRHSSPNTTEQYYIKNSGQDRRAAEASKVHSVEQKRIEAAGTIGDAFKRSIQ